VIQHSMITKSIERAQRKVEENNFGIRKRLLEYDDVMNSQREVIYKRRKHALFGDRLELDIQNMFRDLAEQVVINNQDAKDYDGFKMDLLQYFGMDASISENDFSGTKAPELIENIYKQARQGYKRRMDSVTTSAMPVIQQVHAKENNFENIAIPFSDGKRSLQIVANIEKCLETEGKILRNSLEKSVTLSIIDNEWKEHLREMDDLRQSVQNARFEQKDPLLIYKFESFELFKKMIGRVSKEVVSFLSKAALPGRADQVQTTNRSTTAKDDSSKLQMSRPGLEQAAPSNGRPANPRQAPPPPRKTEPIRAEKKIGRNDPCPCGSGKKYKQCHGKAVSQV
jgi:preprotein translocase subunit SecA